MFSCIRRSYIFTVFLSFQRFLCSFHIYGIRRRNAVFSITVSFMLYSFLFVFIFVSLHILGLYFLRSLSFLQSLYLSRVNALLLCCIYFILHDSFYFLALFSLVSIFTSAGVFLGFIFFSLYHFIAVHFSFSQRYAEMLHFISFQCNTSLFLYCFLSSIFASFCLIVFHVFLSLCLHIIVSLCLSTWLESTALFSV